MTRDSDALRTPYRSVRPVGAPDDGPWPGMLVCLPSGERRVLVDAATVGTEWRGWDASSDGHVLAVLDVVRRADGHDVALPVCTERIVDLLARRRAHGASPTLGEAVTLGVSVLRGCAELRRTPDATGEWWLTEAGRPVFATDAAARPVREASVVLLSELAAGTGGRDAWADAVAAVTAERWTTADFDRAEALLFDLADPLPVTTAISGPRAARDLARYDRDAAVAVEPEHVSRPWDGLLRHVDADLADLVSRVTTRIWRRASTRSPSRRAPWLLAGGAAALVLGAGLMWPAGPDDVPAAGAAETTPAASNGATPTSAAPPDAASDADATSDAEGAEADLAAILHTLLDARLACDGDSECLAPVVRDPASSWSTGPIDEPRERREVVLLDDFGGVAVLRVDARDESASSQLVVIERRDDEWLLRDVHDVAQQP